MRRVKKMFWLFMTKRDILLFVNSGHVDSWVWQCVVRLPVIVYIVYRATRTVAVVEVAAAASAHIHTEWLPYYFHINSSSCSGPFSLMLASLYYMRKTSMTTHHFHKISNKWFTNASISFPPQSLRSFFMGAFSLVLDLCACA